MEVFENRVLNGVLKFAPDVSTIDAAQRLLARDVEIVADSERSGVSDLWPCIWALAAILERQFSGAVFIRCGLKSFLPQPSMLGSRCKFVSSPVEDTLKIGLGGDVESRNSDSVWGDARGSTLSYGTLIPGREHAHPITSFALAGYLGYTALARAVRMPPHKPSLASSLIHLPLFEGGEVQGYPEGLTFIGLGQLGQAYLCLLYFMLRKFHTPPRIVLVDKDYFEEGNHATQLLLDDLGTWNGMAKSQYLEAMLKEWGCSVEGGLTQITWEWKRPHGYPKLAILGLDDFDVRRMVIEAGFDWVIEAGLGTEFARPHITWHSLPPSRALAKRLFVQSPEPMSLDKFEDKLFVSSLRKTPGECGWVTFKNVRASAPSMGAVAAAYTWAEILRSANGLREAVDGSAYLWSPLLPFWRIRFERS